MKRTVYVIASDLHLSDEPERSKHLKKTAGMFLSDIAARLSSFGLKLKEAEMVLLGDTLELLRSKAWLDPAQNPKNIRPWKNDHICQTEHLNAREKLTSEITGKIIAQNREIFSLFKKFKQVVLVEGNHDRLLFDSQKTKQVLLKNLPGVKFVPNEYIIPQTAYLVHGDCYDPVNRPDTDQPCSLGDAVVIEFINRISHEAKNMGARPGLVRALSEIDNVRPVSSVPLWLEWLAERTAKKTGREIIYSAWETAAEKFSQCSYVRQRDSWFNPFDEVDKLESAFQSPRFLQQGFAHCNFFSEKNEAKKYMSLAVAEKKYLPLTITGHTHYPVFYNAGRSGVYVNTGTWRRVHLHSAGSGPFDFLPCTEFTCALVIKDGENPPFCELITRTAASAARNLL